MFLYFVDNFITFNPKKIKAYASIRLEAYGLASQMGNALGFLKPCEWLTRSY